MDRYEYIKLPLEIFPAEIIQQYKLQYLANNDFVCMEIQKGMDGLTQAGKFSNYKLKLHMKKFGYEQAHGGTKQAPFNFQM